MIKFGYEKEKSLYEEYMNSWIEVFPVGRPSSSGKLVSIVEDNLVLNPFSKKIYSTEGDPIYKLTCLNSKVNFSQGITIEPTTEEELKNSIECFNKKVWKKEFKEKKILQKTNQLTNIAKKIPAVMKGIAG